MICPKCGEEMPDSEKVCRKCKAAEEKQSPRTQPDTEPEEKAEKAPAPGIDKKTIAIAAAAVVLVAGIFIIRSLPDDKISTSSSSQAETTAAAETTTTAETTAAAASEAPSESDEEPALSEDESSSSSADIDSTYKTKFEGYDAFLMFGDKNWRFGNWNGTGEETEGFGIDADITGDGEYTVTLNELVLGPEDRINDNADTDEDGNVVPAQGTVVFCVDIIGICDGTTYRNGDKLIENKLSDAEDGRNYPNVDKSLKGRFKGDSSDVKVKVTSIKADGKEVEFDPDKIIYGNAEDNSNVFRIEIYNEYSDTKESPPIDKNALTFKELSVTFTIEGLGEVGPFDTPEWAG